MSKLDYLFSKKSLSIRFGLWLPSISCPSPNYSSCFSFAATNFVHFRCDSIEVSTYFTHLAGMQVSAVHFYINFMAPCSNARFELLGKLTTIVACTRSHSPWHSEHVAALKAYCFVMQISIKVPFPLHMVKSAASTQPK